MTKIPKEKIIELLNEQLARLRDLRTKILFSMLVNIGTVVLFLYAITKMDDFAFELVACLTNGAVIGFVFRDILQFIGLRKSYSDLEEELENAQKGMYDLEV